MSRWAALITDPTAGGTTLDVIEGGGTPLLIPAPNLFAPVTTAQVDAGETPLSRNDENRGRRANAAPTSFASAPIGSLGGRAYPKIINKLWRDVLGGAVTTTGTAPAAITSKIPTLQTGNLPALVLWLLREEQLDRLTGAIVSQLELDLPVEGDGTWTASLPALFHDVQSSTSPKDPGGGAAAAYPTPDYTGFEETYKLRDCIAKRGSAEEELANLAGIKLTFNNGMIEDFRTRFRPNHNILVVEIGGVKKKLWYPAKHKIGAQNVTGTITASSVDAAAEARRRFAVAEKLIVESFAGPLATTPPSTEGIRLVLSKMELTGGGAEPLQREGDQTASFEFSAYVDEATNTDVEAQIVAAAAVA